MINVTVADAVSPCSAIPGSEAVFVVVPVVMVVAIVLVIFVQCVKTSILGSLGKLSPSLLGTGGNASFRDEAIGDLRAG